MSNPYAFSVEPSQSCFQALKAVDFWNMGRFLDWIVTLFPIWIESDLDAPDKCSLGGTTVEMTGSLKFN